VATGRPLDRLRDVRYRHDIPPNRRLGRSSALPHSDPPFWWPRSNRFLDRLRSESAPPVTLWVSLGSANVVELIAAHQPDALLLDLEHTTTGLSEIQTMILAAQNARVAALVRVPGADRHEVGRILDAGADGIVFPRVSNVAEAREAAQSVQYPPRGTRGWAGTHARRTAWGGPPAGTDGGSTPGILSPKFVDAANNAVATIFMIEDPDGAAAIDDILDAGTPDAVIFGRADFIVQSEFDASAVNEAQIRTYEACRGRGIGIALGTSTEDAERYYPGCFISAGVEASLFSTAIAQQIEVSRTFGRRVSSKTPL
jgi:4-hydroxy-2-oxoheptanedioate aldolase